MNRRTFLQTAVAGAALGAAGLPRAGRAASGSDLKFLFVVNSGGWDPTRAFAAEFSNNSVDMEADAAPATAGGIPFVSHPSRPAVDVFFAQHSSRMLVLNGVLVRSISHDICTLLALTGSTSGLTADWPALIASQAADRFTLPHLVLGGPSFPGDQGVAVARAGQNGQLEGLLSGNILGWSDRPVAPLSQPASSALDSYLLRRATARAQGARGAADVALAEALRSSTEKAIDLKDYRYVMDFTGGADLASQAAVAVDALSVGLSRCVTLGYSGEGLGWDTHANNDETQSTLFEGLFQGLGQLMLMLETTPGQVAPTLAEETVVVVLSEMGRTAQLNGTAGKDHWPYTSTLIVGPGLSGGRAVGGLDAGFYGENIDFATGEVDAGGRMLTAEAVGATLLALADIDPHEHLADTDPIEGLLS